MRQTNINDEFTLFCGLLNDIKYRNCFWGYVSMKWVSKLMGVDLDTLEVVTVIDFNNTRLIAENFSAKQYFDDLMSGKMEFKKNDDNENP